ncbi:MAG: HAD-IC family P-type ATPase, partial [Oscillospiraceae bacterium]|nr:HAD-IC family P-type ATPase [Oscillospiraceae bacterium]
MESTINAAGKHTHNHNHNHNHSHGNEDICSCGHDHSVERTRGHQGAHISHTCSCGHAHTGEAVDTHERGCSCALHEEHPPSKLLSIAHISGGVLFAAAFAVRTVVTVNTTVNILLFAAAYLLLGADVLWSSLNNLRRGHWLDETFLMSIASLGAFAIGEYPEGAMIMLLYQVGGVFQQRAVSKSRKSIDALLDIRPDVANLVQDGIIRSVHPSSVAPGSAVLVRPGERVPLDGVVTEGSCMLNTAALTGESLPRATEIGTETLSGSIVISGTIQLRVTKPYNESAASRIAALAEGAAARKTSMERFITRFARVYTPAVVAAAALVAGLPPLLFGGAFAEWLHRALILLVVSCPCALVVSIPLSTFAAIGAASRIGVLIKGASCLDTLCNVDTVAFDKTGTLTHGGQHEGIRRDAADAIRGLKRQGVRNVVMLTGDNKPAAERIASELELDAVYSQLLPDEKQDVIEAIMACKQTSGAIVFVGDGVNDAPALARADLGISMGRAGSDAAIEIADIVLMTDEPSRLADAMRIARRTRRVMIQNIALTLGIKAAVMCLGAAGMTNLWLAIFADIGVAVLAVLNSVQMIWGSGESARLS